MNLLFDSEGRLRQVVGVFFLWVVAVLLTTFLINRFVSSVDIVYSNKFQVAIFAGFLTLGSFLLTLKTFVVIQFKTQLFEREPYQKVFEATKTKATYKKGDYYEPLNNMAKLLLLAVICSLVTSFAQITIGFVSYSLVSAFCMALGVSTLGVVCFAWLLVRRNTLMMIDHWEAEAASKFTLPD